AAAARKGASAFGVECDCEITASASAVEFQTVEASARKRHSASGFHGSVAEAACEVEINDVVIASAPTAFECCGRSASESNFRIAAASQEYCRVRNFFFSLIFKSNSSCTASIGVQ